MMYKAHAKRFPQFNKELEGLRAASKSGLRAKLRLLELLGAGNIAHSYKRKGTLKDFYSSMERLEKLLKEPSISKTKIPARLKITEIEGISDCMADVKKAFNAMKEQPSTANKARLFDSVEMMRVNFGSDYMMIVERVKKPEIILVSSLIANMRHAVIREISNDPNFKRIAKEAGSRVEKSLPALSVEAGTADEMVKRFENPSQPYHEFTGGMKIEIADGKAVARLSFINRHSFFFDNPVLLEPLMRSKSDFYLHTHPTPQTIYFTSHRLKNARWNLDIETADALGFPFILFTGRRFFVYNRGKQKEIFPFEH